MASEERNCVSPRRPGNGLGSQLVFQGGDSQFCRSGEDPAAARNLRTAEFAVDGEARFFRTQGAELRRCVYGSPSRTGPDQRPENHEWNAEGSNGTPSGDGSDGEEDEDDDELDDDDEEGDGEIEGLVPLENGNNKNHNNSSGSVQSSSEKIHHVKVNLKEHHSSFGSNRSMVNGGNSDNDQRSLNVQQQQQGRVGPYNSAVTVAEPDMYYGQILRGGDSLGAAQKEMGGENGCGYSGGKDISLSVESGESVRTYLSDPVTGALMDDAMILSCGHSFGSSGMQYVIRMKACFKCAQPISQVSLRPNLALRSAVKAFQREEELQSLKVSKRRRDRFEQDKCNYDDPFPMDLSRGKGVQFPFVVSDRVIIKGNKRTPPRFVGCVAVITTQCLNGWYVVKTLDNAESVKVQYRSLAKLTDDSASNMISDKAITSNWL